MDLATLEGKLAFATQQAQLSRDQLQQWNGAVGMLGDLIADEKKRLSDEAQEAAKKAKAERRASRKKASK